MPFVKEKVLIADDDQELLDIIRRYLDGKGLETLAARDGEEALAAALSWKPDLLLTDVDMPRMDGFTLCRRLKENPALRGIPIIIMSGKKVSEGDMVSGYAFGADDYVVKPFSYPLLLAKIQAVARRGAARQQKASRLKAGTLAMNLEGRTARLGSRELKLTSKEFDLLAALVSNPGRVLSLTGLLEAVWGYNTADYNNTHTVEVHVSNMRKKLGTFAKRIGAVPGHGYKFE
jgi:DNA-binding response OmpR family regulator